MDGLGQKATLVGLWIENSSKGLRRDIEGGNNTKGSTARQGWTEEGNRRHSRDKKDWRKLEGGSMGCGGRSRA